ncbi:MAG: hypothetical protein H0W88_02540 [Parachlamydiaceae bacterium]|nr:hypothetical protein [Parachlamydiaceae bacterium]
MKNKKLTHWFFGILSSILFTGCQPSMTRVSFEQIPIGAPVASLKEQAGDPYEIIQEEDGSQKYRYLERTQIGPTTIDQTTYDLKVVNGQVVYKECRQADRPLNISTP